MSRVNIKIADRVKMLLEEGIADITIEDEDTTITGRFDLLAMEIATIPLIGIWTKLPKRRRFLYSQRIYRGSRFESRTDRMRAVEGVRRQRYPSTQEAWQVLKGLNSALK